MRRMFNDSLRDSTGALFLNRGNDKLTGIVTSL